METLLTTEQEEEKSSIIIYLAGLAEMAYRLGRQTEAPEHKPFNFFDMDSTQYMYSFITPFLEDRGISARMAHKQAVKELKEGGWEFGKADDLEHAISTMMMPYDQLSEADLQKLAFWKALVSALLNFYDGFRNRLESELMDALSSTQIAYHLPSMKTIIN